MNRTSSLALLVLLVAALAVTLGVYETRALPASQPKLILQPSNVSVQSASPIATVFPDSSAFMKDIPNDWKIYQNTNYQFEVRYPTNWTDMGRDIAIQDFFKKAPMVDVFDIGVITASGAPADIAGQEIRKRHCMDENGTNLDRIIRRDKNGTLFVEYCSASTETYKYLFITARGTVELAYHDDFPQSSSENDKLHTFNQVIGSLRTSSPKP